LYVFLSVAYSPVTNFKKGDTALGGNFERIIDKTFPAEASDRIIDWKGQGAFGDGTIKIGEEDVAWKELEETKSKVVPAGKTVQVSKMEVKFSRI
jgi:hypothetical protein